MTGKPGRSGGKRLGSGRKLGSATKRVRAELAEAAVHGETPLQYLVRNINDARVPEKRRDELAIAALPYCSPRLAAVVMAHGSVEPVKEIVWRVLPAPSASLIEHEQSEG
jgi:hypothetical protein